MVMDSFDLHPARGSETPGTLWIQRVDLSDPENYRKYLIFRERAERMEAYLRRVFGMQENSAAYQAEDVQEEEDKQPLWVRPLMMLLYLNYLLNLKIHRQQQQPAMLPLPAVLTAEPPYRSVQPPAMMGRFLGENA